jgi:hypothetical protein
VLPDSTGFDQVKAAIGQKRDSEPEKFCSLIQVINEDCFDFGRVVAHGSAVRLTLEGVVLCLLRLKHYKTNKVC